MNLFEKIEEIRRQPEPVRIRYTMFSVSVIMFFVIVIWLFSLVTSFEKTIPEVTEGTEKLSKTLNNRPTESLDDIVNLGKQLEKQPDTAPGQQPSGTDTSPIRQIDPNFGNHPTEDTMPSDTSESGTGDLPVLSAPTATTSPEDGTQPTTDSAPQTTSQTTTTP